MALPSVLGRRGAGPSPAPRHHRPDRPRPQRLHRGAAWS